MISTIINESDTPLVQRDGTSAQCRYDLGRVSLSSAARVG